MPLGPGSPGQSTGSEPRWLVGSSPLPCAVSHDAAAANAGCAEPNYEMTCTLLRPEDIDAFTKGKAAQVNKISANDLWSAPTFLELHDQITGLIKERPIVAFNVDFDGRMLERTYYKYGVECPRINGICIMRLLSAYLNISDYLNLDEAIILFNIRPVRGLDRHSAAFDCYMTYKLLTTLKKLEE
jgi:DNA polymerase III epsilon subunit-like protein